MKFTKITGDFSRKMFLQNKITGDLSKSIQIQKSSMISFFHVENWNFVSWNDFKKSPVIFFWRNIFPLKSPVISRKSPVIFVFFTKNTGDFCQFYNNHRWFLSISAKSPVIFQNHQWWKRNHRWFSGFKRWYSESWGYFIKSPVILDNHRWFHKITS